MGINLRTARRGAVVAVVAAAALLGLPMAAASASTGVTVCSGGPIAAGTYRDLTVTGMCQVAAGTVNVTRNLTVAPNAGLLAAFGGSDLHIGRNLIAQDGSIVVLGCEPGAFTCFNDPDQSFGTLATHDSIGLNFVSTNALMVLAHNNSIAGDVVQNGGGGGVTCSNFPLGPSGPPAYSTWEDNMIGRNAVVGNVRTCWMGFIRNTVAGNVSYSNNVLADPDGNEVVSNHVGRNLNCDANVPAVQVGDSMGNPNVVGGRANGQCAHTVAVG